MTQETPLPSYDDLLKADPPGSAWDYFGRDDQLGTINFLTPEVRLRAAGLIREGRTINLDYTLSEFDPFPSGTRPPNQHHLFSNNPFHFDDWLDSFYLQSTTQIDGLRHMRHLWRHSRNGGQSDWLYGFARLLGLGMEVDSRDADSLCPGMSGAAG